MKKWLYFGAYLTFLGFFLYFVSSLSFLYQSKISLQPSKQILGWENYIAQTSCNVTPYACGGAMYFDTAYCVCKCPSYPTCTAEQIWDPYYCVCKPNTSCTPPSGGCTNGTFNYSTCTCEYSSGGGGYCLTPQTCPTGMSWNSSTCSCVTSSTCPTPVGGCPSGTGFNFATCQCEIPAGYCLTQHSCPTGKHWSSSVCNCVTDSTACVTPVGGCGTGGTFNYTTCNCESATAGGGYCSTPQPCSDGYAWSASACICVAAGTTNNTNGSGYGCLTPSSCPVNSYWNTSTCQCAYSANTCTAPSSGCGTNYYWDGTSCICRPLGYNSTYCSPPSAGCGSNYYWDGVACACKYYSANTSSCFPPSSGCGLNYYWDSYSCSCRPKNSCYSPTPGCGLNYYWDGNTCSCKYKEALPTGTTVATGCYPPSSGCAMGYYWDTTKCICTYSQAYFDRLAYEKPAIISCIKNNLSESEYQTLRYLVGTNQKDKDLVSSIYEKVKNCYSQTTAVAEGNITPVVSTPPTPLEKESCLLSLIGERAYSEINSGIREATYLEKFAFGKCYPDKSSIAPEYITSNEDLTNETTSCLKSVLGVRLYESVRRGEKNVPYELVSEVDKCFGANIKPFVSSVSEYRTPDDVLSCLKNVVGESSFNLILSGQLLPTEEERLGAKTCFDKLNSEQSKFIPPPVEQVPYLLEKNGEIKVSNAKQEVSKKRNKVIDNKIVLNGKGPKDSVVTIYVFSEPIVVTTKTDENGDWIYELNDPVTGGKHIAYATVKTEAGDVRSSVFSFDVSAAEPDVNDIFVEESKAAPTISKFMVFSLSLVGVGLLLLLSGIFIIRRTDENQHNFLSTFKRLLTGYRVKG